MADLREWSWRAQHDPRLLDHGIVHAVSPLARDALDKRLRSRYPGYPAGVMLEPHITGHPLERELQSEGICERGPCECRGVCRARSV